MNKILKYISMTLYDKNKTDFLLKQYNNIVKSKFRKIFQ